MNITISIDEITLNTLVAEVVSYDEYGDTVPTGKEKTVADLVADRIADRVAGSAEFKELRKRVTTIRDEMIREMLKPTLAEALQAPIRRTNTYGEPTGEVLTLRELVMAASQDLLSERDRRGHNGASWVQNYIYEQVRNLYTKDLQQEVAAYRAELEKQLKARLTALSLETVDSVLHGKH